MALVFEENRIGSRGSISHAQVEKELVNFLGSTRSGGSGKVYVSDDRCFAVVLLLLRVSDFFTGDFLFPFFLFLTVCIFNVRTCSRYYIVAETGCNWYHLGINIYSLYRKKGVVATLSGQLYLPDE
jgi:hypothetical protein